MGENSMGKILEKLIIAGLIFGLGACGSSGGGEDTAGDGVFTPDGVGTISIDLNEDQLEVSDTTGFHARLVNADGEGVPFTRISCDSERGVAIIEPNTGTEISDENGQISGRIGCAAPGSYLFGCRAAVGANKRVFKTIRCSGDVPGGFDGFPGAAGGGLGTGGSGDSDDGGTDGNDTDNGVDMTAIRLQDSPGAGDDSFDSAIDTFLESDCDNDGNGVGGTIDPEPFTDTRITIDIRNNSNSTITFTSYNYKIFDSDGSVDFTSNSLGFLNSGEVVAEVGATVSLKALFAQARTDGNDATSDKFFYGSSTAIGSRGFTNISVTARGTNDQGDAIVVTGTTAVSFDGYNNCGG